jgi:outer membrane receptor for ferrienterochelin and colicin
MIKKSLGFMVFIQLTCCFIWPARADHSAVIRSLDENQEIPMSLNEVISIDLNNVSLEKALLIIAEKGKFGLSFNRNDIPVSKKISIKMENIKVIKALEKVLMETGIECVIVKGGLFAIVPGEKIKHKSGTIRGVVSERFNNRKIPGVTIEVMDTKYSTISDTRGEFSILSIPVGSYKLKCSAEGFKTIIRTDIIIRSKRITYVDVKMQEQLLLLKETVEVSTSYFHKDEKNPQSVVSISAEEVRRAPGTGGGLSRMLKTLPGVTTSADDDTDIVVRGGSPNENGYIIDNIEVSHIDHLPNIASSGGSYPALHADLIQNVNFYRGGFSSNYNGFLSAITDIALREGNRSEFDGQFNIDMAGAGFIFEGPVSKGRGAWLITIRKSYLKLLKNLGLLDVGGAIASIDSQIKITYDISPTQKINLLYFHLSGDYDESGTGIRIQESDKYNHHTMGINWISNWSQNFFSTTSLAFSANRSLKGERRPIFDMTVLEEIEQQPIWDVNDLARVISLRNSNYLVLNTQNKLEFGLQIKHESEKLKEIIHPMIGEDGNMSQKKQNNYAYFSTKFGLFFSYIGNLFKQLMMTIGVRGDYSSATGIFNLSPRLSLKYEINKRLSLDGGLGVFYQSLPAAFLAYIPGASGLQEMKATHYILGMEFFLGHGTKLTLEGYIKDYNHLPISPENERWLAIDFAVGRFRENYFTPVGYRVPKSLGDGGKGSSKGIELLIQKKLVNKFYGFLSASYFRSRYKDLTGKTHNRVYDNRLTLNLSIGYKPNRFWEFSAKWTLMGGGPYTPIDVQASTQAQWEVLDDSRFLQERYPMYSSINLRVDKRFYFRGTNLTIFLDFWNVLNHKNVLLHWWGTWEDIIFTEYQMGMLPVLGIEFEF